MYTLQTTVTNEEPNQGFFYGVNAGEMFNFSDFCEAYDLDSKDFDEQEVKHAQNEAAKLAGDEMLIVEFEKEQ